MAYVCGPGVITNSTPFYSKVKLYGHPNESGRDGQTREQVPPLYGTAATHLLIAAVGPVLSDLQSQRSQNYGFSGEISQFVSAGSILRKYSS